MMAGLAYVPVRDVKRAFRILKAQAPDVGNMDQLVDYFDKTYVNGVPGAGQRRRVPPLFEPELWNVYKATLEDLAATNNASEGWHNRFATILNRKHPDLYSLLDALKMEQADTEIAITELRMGRKVKAAQKKKWADYHARVRTCVENYDGIDNVLPYLERISCYVNLD